LSSDWGAPDRDGEVSEWFADRTEDMESILLRLISLNTILQNHPGRKPLIGM
jgi:hypothetical protein